MNVKTLYEFHDNLKGVRRKVGDEFVVSRERFAEINEAGMAQVGQPLVEMVPEEPRTPESGKAQARKRTAKKDA